MCLARIESSGAIYNASAAARNFAKFKLGNCDVEVCFEGNEGKMHILVILNQAISNAFRDLNFVEKK